MSVLWTVCIATLASRDAKFRDLMGTLLPQAEAAGGIEVVACHNNGEQPLGDIRQALLMAAAGEYVSFLDDDDTSNNTDYRSNNTVYRSNNTDYRSSTTDYRSAVAARLRPACASPTAPRASSGSRGSPWPAASGRAPAARS